jgi:ADP-heptose:LPS heptosyltransferase
MTRTLVWHQGALGDLIISLPVLKALKSGGRAAHIHLISRTDIADMLIENRLADEVSSIERGLFADFFVGGPLSPRAAEFLEKFRNAFIFMKKTDEVFATNLGKHIQECFFISTAPPDGRVIHISASQMYQLTQLGTYDEEMPFLKTRPYLSEIHGKRAVITVHPGSGGKKKCWPLEKFLELMHLLDKGKRFYFYFVLGPAEGHELHEKANRFISANSIDGEIIGGRPVSYIATLLKASSLHIGNDSGITHLASALGTPTIAVFGPTDPKVWGPVGRHVKIVTSDYPCAPCAEKDRRQCSDVRCLDAVEVGDVLLTAQTLFLKDNNPPR